ncbi:MAG: DUF1003 domain-containing protein [Ktedonobacteraceae bacterium]
MQDNHNEITELTDILDRDIETIVAMRMRAEGKVSHHQRHIEKVSSTLGQPGAVYTIMLLVVLWITVNGLHSQLGLSLFDAPPFSWLQGIISLSALIMTVVVLTTQNRQGKMTEQRRHLDLQITLLTERKVSKVIALIEELRRDLPSVTNRLNTEAEVMQEPIDPHAAFSALNEAAKKHHIELE